MKAITANNHWNAQHIATQLERHLALDTIDQPSIEQAITRLYFVDENLVQAEQWEELEWLIQETKHYAQKRESKHPLFKIGPRRNLQYQIGYFSTRSAIVAAAILSCIEARYLQLRGRTPNNLQAAAMTALDYPSAWFSLKEASDTLSRNIEKASIIQTAQLLNSITSPITHMIEHTRPSPNEIAPAETLAHFKWHTVEISTLSSSVPFIQEWKILKQQNHLLEIALEKLLILLNILRNRLIEQSL